MKLKKTLMVSVLMSVGVLASHANAITPTPTPVASSVPAWNSASTYTAGQKVTQNGMTYKAQWWTQGENPATSGAFGAWKAETTASPNGETWRADAVYTVGQRSTYNGTLYEAKWYTTGENPSRSGEWGAWKDLGLIPVFVSAMNATQWKDDATAAYSMMHDDLCGWITDGQIDFAAPALKERGLVSSFGMITGHCGDKHWTAAKQFIADGHEIFSHTRSHTDAMSRTWDAATEISGSSDDIAGRLNGYRPSFFAWPSGVAADEPMTYLQSAAGFIGGRAANRVDPNGMIIYDGHGSGVNGSSIADPFQVKDDMFTLTAQWSPYEAQVKAGGDLLNLHVDAAIANGGWANRTMHGVNDASWNSVPLAQYTAHLDYIKTKVDARLLWVATPSQILKYSKAREACKPSLSNETRGSVIQFASNDAECVKFATPLTLMIAGERKVAIQAGKPVPSLQSKVIYVNGLAAAQAQTFLITVDPLAGPVTFMSN